MPVTKILSKWENGDLVFTDHGGTEILKIEDGNQAIDIAKLRLAGVAVTATAAQLNSVSAAITVANKTGGPLTKGTLVYISGYDATLAAPSVTVSSATAKATHVLTEDIANNASGTADEEAIVTGIDTDAVGAVGDPIYLAAAGGFGTAGLTGADEIYQLVGVVITKHAVTGSALFFPGASQVGALGTSAIQALAVTSAKLSTDSVTTAKIQDDAVTSAKLATTMEKFADVTLTSAQVKALNATPIEIVPSAPVDFAIVPTAINIVVDYGGTNAFTETSDDLSIGYAGGAEIMEIESTGLIDQENDEWRYITFEHAETFVPEENKAVVITNLDDEIAGNAGDDNRIHVRLYYRVVPTDLA